MHYIHSPHYEISHLNLALLTWCSDKLGIFIFTRTTNDQSRAIISVTVFRTNSSTATVMPQSSICIESEFHIFFFTFISVSEYYFGIFLWNAFLVLRNDAVVVEWLQRCRDGCINWNKIWNNVMSDEAKTLLQQAVHLSLNVIFTAAMLMGFDEIYLISIQHDVDDVSYFMWVSSEWHQTNNFFDFLLRHRSHVGSFWRNLFHYWYKWAPFLLTFSFDFLGIALRGLLNLSMQITHFKPCDIYMVFSGELFLYIWDIFCCILKEQ